MASKPMTDQEIETALALRGVQPIKYTYAGTYAKTYEALGTVSGTTVTSINGLSDGTGYYKIDMNAAVYLGRASIEEVRALAVEYLKCTNPVADNFG